MEEGCITAANYIVVWYKGKIGERKIGGAIGKCSTENGSSSKHVVTQKRDV